MTELNDALAEADVGDVGVYPPELVVGHAKPDVSARDVQLEVGTCDRAELQVLVVRLALRPGQVGVDEVMEDIADERVVAGKLNMDRVPGRPLEVGESVQRQHEVVLERRDPDVVPVASRGARCRDVVLDRGGACAEIDHPIGGEVDRGVAPAVDRGHHGSSRGRGDLSTDVAVLRCRALL